MEQRTVEFTYRGSGIKTLRVLGKVFLALGCLAALILLILGVDYLTDSYSAEDLALMAALFTPSILLPTAGALCLGVAGIAETALYQRAILEEDNELVEE